MLLSEGRRLNQDAMLGLIEAIYSASLQPAEWTGVLQTLADAVGAREASLGILAANEAPWIIAPRTDPDFALSYLQHYHPLNLFWRQVTRQPIGVLATDTMLLPRERLQASQFFNEWSAPQGYRTVMGTTLAQSGSGRIELQIPGSTDFDDEHLRIVRTLVPHLTRGTAIMGMLRSATAEQAGLLGAIDQLGRGILVLDRFGRLLHANAIGERVLAEARSLCIRDGKLHAQATTADRDLQRLVQSCSGSTISAGGRMQLPNVDHPLLSVQLSPLPVSARDIALPHGQVLVVIANMGTGLSSEHQRFQQRYGLTAAELALALEIAHGDGREAAARRRGISVSTARTHLSSIFDKTGVRRQAELVRLLGEIQN